MIHRRTILQLVPALGISSTVFARALALQAEGHTSITAQMIEAAQWVSGIKLDQQQIEALVGEVDKLHSQLAALRQIALDPQEDLPAIALRTLHQPTARDSSQPQTTSKTSTEIEAIDANQLLRPESDEELAFLPAYQLAALIRARQVSSVELTQLYLQRLQRYDAQLHCVVNLTESLAMRQAEQADQEIAAGQVRGPLHGVPWGAKDLIAVEGYPTTWGLPGFRDRQFNKNATVADRLSQAGAVLVAKLSLGAIAMGDQWFGGTTRNPWNIEQGSSGSSAGSCAGSSAGLVGFALGSETLGSILTPSARCASHGLRPTFGRVSRAGCMPLSWSMDKIGPIARSVRDLALVFAAIHGADHLDPTSVDAAFNWPPKLTDFTADGGSIDWSKMTVGVVKRSSPDPALPLVESLGCKIREVELPGQIPWQALANIIDVEGAAVFDDLLKAGLTEGWNSWTKTFQAAQYVSAIDYLRMQRVRRKLMIAFEDLMQSVDVLLNTGDLVYTNFTGHPSVSMPYVAPQADPSKKPSSLVITGRLFGEETILALAQAIEERQPKPLPRPKL